MTKKRVQKKSSLEKKSHGISMGVNSSNISQLKRIAKADTTKEIPQVPFVDLYMRVKGVWQHKGKSCRLCGSMMTHPEVIDKHRYICKSINTRKETTDAST
jgi:hypothetical protein